MRTSLNLEERYLNLLLMRTLLWTVRVINGENVFLTELKGYAYWTSGKYNESATEWQWFSNKKPLVFGDLLSNTEQVKDKEDVLNKCLLSNYIEEDYLSGGFASRYCASFGYRFTCEATLMSQSWTSSRIFLGIHFELLLRIHTQLILKRLVYR